MKTVVGLYDRLDEARQAIADLKDAGFRSEDISIIARDANGEYSRHLGGDRPAEANDISDGTAAGAGIGAVLGGLGGLLVGLGALAIPGIGPVLAAGPLVSALAGAGVGALAGGIVGALVDLGIPDEHADYYAEGIRRGGTLVIVRADDMVADRAMTIMNRYNPVDMNERTENWRQSGWQRYDPDADPLTADDMEFNRPMSQSTSVPVTGESTFGLDSQDLDRDDMENDYRYDRQETNIPVTGQTADPMTTDRDTFRDMGMNRDINMDRDVHRDDVEHSMMDQGYDYNDVDARFMPHYQSYYQTTGRDYGYYQPAYRYGYELANDPRYRDYDWDQLEMVAREDWDRRGSQSMWEDIKDAVRHAWFELRH